MTKTKQEQYERHLMAQVEAMVAAHAEAIRAAGYPLAAREAVAAAIGRSLTFAEGEAVSAASRAMQR